MSVRFLSSSSAAPANAAAVLFSAEANIEVSPIVALPIDTVPFITPENCGNGDDKCRGSNQLLWISKKQWSDQ
jgi:hypothetical protein